MKKTNIFKGLLAFLLVMGSPFSSFTNATDDLTDWHGHRLTFRLVNPPTSGDVCGLECTYIKVEEDASEPRGWCLALVSTIKPLNEGDIILEDVLGELNGQCGECYITVHTTAGPASIRFMIDGNDVWVREANIVISTSDVTKTLSFESQSNDVN